MALQKNRESADEHEHSFMKGNVLPPPCIRRRVELLCPLLEVQSLPFSEKSFSLFVRTVA